jgi:uncharacterized protein (TIGR02231 family)
MFVELLLFWVWSKKHTMRYTYLLPVISLLSGASFVADATNKEQLNIHHVTVFLRGAELECAAKVQLNKGENEVIFTNVAGNINTQSLTVGASNGVVVQSATFRNNYLEPATISARAQELTDSIELLRNENTDIANHIAVINEEIGVLDANKKVGGDNTGLSVAELSKMLDIVSARMIGYLSQRSKLNKQQENNNDHIARLATQVNSEQQKSKQPGGVIDVKFYAPSATTAEVGIDYVTPNAGWVPTYDVMADKTNGPIDLFYKANLHQNSGLNWNNVPLTLSTANPNEGAQAPVLMPWYLSFYSPRAMVASYKKPLVDRDRPDAQQSNEDVYQAVRGADISMDGARTSGTTYIVDGVQVQNASVDNYVSVNNDGISTSFDIDIPYTIPADGQEHVVSVKKYELPATYRYYAVPKLDKDAFLQAEVTGWDGLNLLPGKSNIFYEGTYVGQGYLDARNIKDTLSISLGRDKKIVIKKEQDSKLRSVHTIGSNVREQSAYNISVRNTRKEPVTLIIEDQLPVSTDKDILVEDIDNGGASVEDKTGKLTWSLTLNGNEQKQLSFGYTLKYPKGRTLEGMK